MYTDEILLHGLYNKNSQCMKSLKIRVNQIQFNQKLYVRFKEQLAYYVYLYVLAEYDAMQVRDRPESPTAILSPLDAGSISSGPSKRPSAAMAEPTAKKGKQAAFSYIDEDIDADIEKKKLGNYIYCVVLCLNIYEFTT